ncbi:MAG: hypothetical protein JWQ35_2228 [Bacteriovoracaceae bacterium]|nr:hypothetical protein [Bacteriovoracaceae bacterium]
MGRGDNRRSRKVVQRHGQKKKKARLARKALAKKTERQTKKPAAKARA